MANRKEGRKGAGQVPHPDQIRSIYLSVNLRTVLYIHTYNDTIIQDTITLLPYRTDPNKKEEERAFNGCQGIKRGFVRRSRSINTRSVCESRANLQYIQYSEQAVPWQVSTYVIGSRDARKRVHSADLRGVLDHRSINA